jgi:hypothetical protein
VGKRIDFTLQLRGIPLAPYGSAGARRTSRTTSLASHYNLIAAPAGTGDRRAKKGEPPMAAALCLRAIAPALVTLCVAPVYSAEIVLDAASGARVGAFAVVNDPAASNGTAVSLPDQGRLKAVTAVAQPADYLELTFTADANTPYHLWVRLRAADNTYANDSFHVQFTNVAAAAIGTTSSYVVNLEEASGAGVSGYGWQDNGYGAGVMARTFFLRPGARSGSGSRTVKTDSSSTRWCSPPRRT